MMDQGSSSILVLPARAEEGYVLRPSLAWQGFTVAFSTGLPNGTSKTASPSKLPRNPLSEPSDGEEAEKRGSPRLQPHLPRSLAKCPRPSGARQWRMPGKCGGGGDTVRGVERAQRESSMARGGDTARGRRWRRRTRARRNLVPERTRSLHQPLVWPRGPVWVRARGSDEEVAAASG